MKAYTSVTEIIGRTPLLELNKLKKTFGINCNLYAKLEYLNPSGSIKDRTAAAMIDDAERRGLINPETVIIEPTSGNTGIGLASVCAVKSYRLIIVMPENMSVERKKLIAAYGAELVLTDGKSGMAGAIKKAGEIAESLSNSFIPAQFINPANPEIHFNTTGPEIWEDTGGSIDVFVAGIGTGGTLSGAGGFLKIKKPSVKITAVLPEIETGHGIQGIGAGFVPKNLDESIIDETIRVSDKEAYDARSLLARTEGVFAGISSGAALWAALELAKRPENTEKNIVIIFPDTGERYLSSDI